MSPRLEQRGETWVVMDSSGRRATPVEIDLWRERGDAMRLLAVIVQQAGGELTVQSSAYLSLPPRWRLRRDDDPEQRWIRFQVEVDRG